MAKKQSWIKENWGSVLLGIIIGVIIITIIHTNSTSYICSKSPEKCVCEYTTTQGIQISAKTELCDGRGGDYNFRLKTQAELDIDFCNLNPREDEKCKCIEKEDWCKVALDYVNYIPCVWVSKCIKSRPKTDWENHPEDYVAETKLILGEQIQIDCNKLIVGDSAGNTTIRTICREKTK